jgi:phosphoribosylformylglycinamidine synthase
MTSGKDSMKNDFKSDGVKISVPPTILYSVVAKIPDVRKTVTSEFKYCGDMIYLIGTTYDELGESEFCKLLHVKGGKTPIVRKGLAHFVYQKMIQAHTMDLLESAHDISDGGMIIALIESLLGNSLGAEIILPHNENLSIAAQLFSESHSRFIVSIKPNQQELFESIFSDQATHLGTVTNSGKISVIAEDKVIIRQDVSALCKIWSEALEETIQR